MMTSQFKNPADEYFVATVLRACLILIISTFIAQIACLVSIVFVSYFFKQQIFLSYFESVIKTVAAFPITDFGIYSVALFIAQPGFELWNQVLGVLLIVPTFQYWFLFRRGPIRNLHQFALFHQVRPSRIMNVLSSFYIAAYVDYYFIVLKKALLPLVFVLVVMDFKIMLPRLVEAGLSLYAFIMFLCLILSLHLLSFGKEKGR